jgi:hypothetical protein
MASKSASYWYLKNPDCLCFFCGDKLLNPILCDSPKRFTRDHILPQSYKHKMHPQDTVGGVGIGNKHNYYYFTCDYCNRARAVVNHCTAIMFMVFMEKSVDWTYAKMAKFTNYCKNPTEEIFSG